MKFLHISDLHLGKRVNEFSMIFEQKHVFTQIIQILKDTQVDAVFLAGDIFDKNIPTIDAVRLFDDFLTQLVEAEKKVFLVSGNHDSPERLNFAGRLLEKQGVYVASVFDGGCWKVQLTDEYGICNIYMLPFIKPAMVTPYFGAIESYQEAVQVVIEQEAVDTKSRNILIAHQFVTNGGVEPMRSESETISIGTLDNIDVSVFSDFDYVALGHLHGSQCIRRETVQYAGSPIKYSFSECNQKKSVILGEIREKGMVSIEKIPLTPLHDMREIKGPLEALINPEYYGKENPLDYIHGTVTDEEELYDAIGQLRSVYPNLMRLDFENSRTRSNQDVQMEADLFVEKTPFQLFAEFYEKSNFSGEEGIPLTQQQGNLVKEILERCI